MLQRPVGLCNIHEGISSSCTTGPILDELEDFGLDIGVDRLGGGGEDVATASSLQQGYQIVHELAAGNLGGKVAASILHACISEV